MIPRRPLVALFLGLILIALGGCGSEPDTPEGQVRMRIGEMEAAAEAGDIGTFKELVSERYNDPYGNDKRLLTSFVTFHVLQNQRGREVIVRLREVQLVEPSRAAVSAHIGLAGAGASSALRGSVYALELDLEQEEDEEWRITWAQWKRAGAGELL